MQRGRGGAALSGVLCRTVRNVTLSEARRAESKCLGQSHSREGIMVGFVILAKARISLR